MVGGSGIQRGYGLPKGEKRFSLFNTRRWALYDGPFSEVAIKSCLNQLREQGSIAAPGFDDPEGIIVFHEAANLGFKVTLKGDECPKSLLA